MKRKFISGYFLLNKVEITEEYEEQLNELKKSYLIEWELLKTINNRELYLGVLRDESKLEDQTDEEGNITLGLFTVMSSRKPEVLGIWKMDGTPLGQNKKIIPAEYNEDELITEQIITYQGNATYPFKKSVYLPYMDDVNTYDNEGNVLTSTRPTEPKPIRLFSGFKSPKMED